MSARRVGLVALVLLLGGGLVWWLRTGAEEADPGLLRLDDFDGHARSYLRTGAAFAEDLGADDEEAAARFVEIMGIARDENLRRRHRSFVLAWAPLIQSVLAPPELDEPEDLRTPEALDPDRLRQSLLEESSDDPTGLRSSVLRRAFEACGLELERADRDAVQRVLDASRAELLRQLDPEAPVGTREDPRLQGPALATASADSVPHSDMLTATLIEGLREVLPSVRRVLVVGPGVSVADAHLGARAPVHSAQPYVLLDLLQRAGMLAEEASVECLDLGEEVVAVIEQARAQARLGRPLELPSWFFPPPLRHHRVGAPEFAAALYTGIGTPVGEGWSEWVSPLALRWGRQRLEEEAAADLARESWTEDQRRSLRNRLELVRRESSLKWRRMSLAPRFVRRVSARQGDLCCERFAEEDRYDLVVATEVFRYYPQTLQHVGLLNLRRVTREGGAMISTMRLTEDIDRTVLGWRLVMEADHEAMRPQLAYRCVKPPR